MLMWWHEPTIPALGRQGWEDLEFQASLGYPQKPSLKQKQTFCMSLILYKDEHELQFCHRSTLNTKGKWNSLFIPNME